MEVEKREERTSFWRPAPLAAAATGDTVRWHADNFGGVAEVLGVAYFWRGQPAVEVHDSKRGFLGVLMPYEYYRVSPP